MMARLTSAFRLSRSEKAYIAAYAIVMSVAAGLTVYVMAGVESDGALLRDRSFYSYWTILAGVIGGALSLYAARGWLGMSGILGWLRALVGGTAAALIAAVIAGSLIMPLYGTFYAPVMLATQFIQMPLLALGWFGAMFGAHALMTTPRDAFGWAANNDGFDQPLSGLSEISRINLHHRR